MILIESVTALLVAGALLLLPGYALLVILRPRWDFGLVETLCAATGLSLAMAPLMLYLATLLGLRLTPASVILYLLVSAGICLWDGWRWFQDWRKQGAWQVDAIYLSLGIVFALTLFSRLWMVRGVGYPLWTDSYHHTVIAQLIADLGTVPSSWEPYAPIERFTYHFGFHTLSAWTHWLSGAAVSRSVVLVGQVINALVVPTSYLFASRLCRSRFAGLVAASALGLFSHMPALYVNWGRYPQLTGLILLPVLLVVTIEALDLDENRFNLWLLAGIGVAGMFLVHIRVFLFYGIFVCLWLLYRLVAAGRGRKLDQVKHLLLGCAVIGAVALLLLTPWFLRFFDGFGSMIAGELSGGYQPERHGSYFRWRAQDLVAFGLPLWLLLLAAAGGLWGILKRNINIMLLIAWLLALFAAANTHLIGILPLYSNLVATISLYLPAATLFGYLTGELAGRAERAHIGSGSRLPRRMMQWVMVLALILIGLLRARYAAALINLPSGFVRQADLDAAEWIQDNVPQDALFHISTHFWTPDVAHGLDAGYWLPLLAHRQTTMPVQTYASDGSPEYMNLVNNRARALAATDTPEEMWQVMAQYDVTHVYLGKRPTNLNPDYFLADPAHFRPLYVENGVWVFEAIR